MAESSYTYLLDFHFGYPFLSRLKYYGWDTPLLLGLFDFEYLIVPPYLWFRGIHAAVMLIHCGMNAAEPYEAFIFQHQKSAGTGASAGRKKLAY